MVDVRQVNPMGQNDPRNLFNQNPLGSDFAAANSLTTSYGLQMAIDPRIIQVMPDEFAAFKWYSMTAKKEQIAKEWHWFQAVYPNMPFIVKTNTAAVAASAGTQVVQTIPINDISIPVLTPGTKVVYPDGTQGVIQSVVRTPGSAAMVVASMNNLGLSAVTAGDIMPNHGSVATDGSYSYDNFHTSDMSRYSNVMEMFYDAIRWDRAQLIELTNTQQLPLIAQRKREMMYRVMAANEARLWLGQYGFNTIPVQSFFNNGTGLRAMYTRGILQHLVADGVATINTTTATCIDDVKQVIWDNRLLAGTKRWLLFATSEKLDAVGINEISERRRYTASDTTVSTEVLVYEAFNGIQLIPRASDAWKDVSYYGNILRDDAILVPDGGDAGISICYMKGYPMMENTVHDRINDGMAQYQINVCRGMWGVEVRKAFVFGRFHFIG